MYLRHAMGKHECHQVKRVQTVLFRQIIEAVEEFIDCRQWQVNGKQQLITLFTEFKGCLGRLALLTEGPLCPQSLVTQEQFVSG